ncbi:hypothetical protein J6590_057290 [Homalodisca vitripennis]|nr:hypothetical protein J6590_057290 [Homalodisca vitripennis]
MYDQIWKRTAYPQSNRRTLLCQSSEWECDSRWNRPFSVQTRPLFMSQRRVTQSDYLPAIPVTLLSLNVCWTDRKEQSLCA